MKDISKLTVFGTAAALAMAVALPGIACADPDPIVQTNMESATSGDSKARILKQINAGASSDIRGTAFVFTFTGLDAETDVAAAQDARNIQIDSVTLTAKNMKNNSDVQYLEEAIILPEVTSFSSAGVYRFQVDETAVNNDKWQSSQAQYIMHVYVENDRNADTLHYKGVTVEKTKADDGTAASGKVDPTDPNLDTEHDTPGIGEDGKNSDALSATASEMKFTNSYIDNDNVLQIEKQVLGDYGDKNKLFSYTVEISIPSYVTINESIAVAADQDQNTATTVTRTVDNTQHKITITNIGLKDNGTYSITNLPIGSTYKVTEAATPRYTPSTTFTNPGGTAVVNSSYSKGGEALVSVAQSDTVAVAQTTTIGDGTSTVNFTNTYADSEVTPTGIAMKAIPYVLLIVIPVGILLSLRLKRKKN